MSFVKRNSKISYKKKCIKNLVLQQKNSINHRPSQCFKNPRRSPDRSGGPPRSRYVAVMEVNGRRPPRPWSSGWVGLRFHTRVMMAREGEGVQGFFGAEKHCWNIPKKNVETQNDDWMICLSIFSVLLPYGINTYILDIHYIGDK